MSQTLASIDDVLVAEFEELARSREAQQSVHGGCHSASLLSEADRAADRELLWKEFSAQYPRLVGAASAPPAPAERALPARVDLDTGRINFSGGVPVGGSAHLSLFSDGTYTFNGHFHVSGAPSYNTSLVIVVADRAGRAIPFAHTGRVHGTFESGSRDDNWVGTQNHPMVKQLWGSGLGASWRWEAHVNLDVRAAVNSAIQAAGYVAAVAAILV